MFLSQSPGERFVRDKTQGPELRQGLELFRVVNRTGLQVRKDITLDSEPCGRLYAGDVFCVNQSSTVLHHHESRRPGKRGKRRMVRLTRLHIVAPRTGWVSGSSKWVSKFQEGGRPGPIALRSTLSDTCPVVMVEPSEDHSARFRPTAKGDGHPPGIQGAGTCEEGNVSTRIDQYSRATTPRTRWLHSRDGVWPVAVSSIPGPKYFPAVSATAGGHNGAGNGVAFPKEQRFLSNVTRYLSKDHERQARGLFSPGPAMYMGHDELMPLPPRPPSTVPGSTRRCPSAEGSGAGGGGDVVNCLRRDSLRAPRAATTGCLSGRSSRRRRRASGDGATHAPYIGIKEREAADKLVLRAKAGATGTPVIRLLVSSRGEREGPDGCFVTRMGAASPGPARHFPNCSSISAKGCPIFASPTALDPAELERQKMREQPRTPQLARNLASRSKSSQVHRRWPSYTHVGDQGGISGSLGQDSPGPGNVNIADHDPFRARSFMRTDVCHPPPAASYSCCVPFWEDEKVSVDEH